MNRAIVIGGGADALVAAQVLARAGREVMVIESASSAPDDGWVPPGVLRELRLEGLNLEWPDPWLVVPLPDGGRLELWRDVARSAESIRRLSARDAERWPAFCERMARLARFLEALYAAAPPDPLGAGFALRARALGKRGLTDLLRILPMPVAELLDDWFEADALKGALGATGILHLLQGPRSGGTAWRGYCITTSAARPGCSVRRAPTSSSCCAGFPGWSCREPECCASRCATARSPEWC
jgi:phytoene dehydrogenase-like protein